MRVSLICDPKCTGAVQVAHHSIEDKCRAKVAVPGLRLQPMPDRRGTHSAQWCSQARLVYEPRASYHRLPGQWWCVTPWPLFWQDFSVFASLIAVSKARLYQQQLPGDLVQLAFGSSSACWRTRLCCALLPGLANLAEWTLQNLRMTLRRGYFRCKTGATHACTTRNRR